MRAGSEPKQAQKVQYPAGKALTSNAESGIIKSNLKLSAPKQMPPDFSKYKITDDPEKVEKVRQKMIDKLHIDPGSINLAGIRNTSVLSPFVNELIKIQERTGMTFSNFIARDIIDDDPCCIASYQPYESKFYISSRFFNSRKALESTMKEWAKNRILPKQAVDIAYLAEHEAAHMRIPTSIFHNDKAKALFMSRTLKNSNDKQIHEYFADVVAIFNCDPNIADENILSAIEYLRDEGVKI